jgi:hypothetical protein
MFVSVCKKEKLCRRLTGQEGDAHGDMRPILWI